MIAVVGVVYTANEDVRSGVDDFIGRRSGASASPTETPVDIERKVQAAVAAAQAPSSPAPDVQATTEAAIASTVEALLPTPTGGAAPLAVASTLTLTPTPAATPSPTHTSSPTATPVPPTATPTPTPTPEPRAVLVLEADAAIDGYWSDGTADVTVSAPLRNDGALRVGAPQTLTSTCTPATDAPKGCQQEITLTLPDGYDPASAKFTIRASMGVTTVMFNYDGDQSLALDVEVPERILGLDRDLWECYSHRPQQETVVNARAAERLRGLENTHRAQVAQRRARQGLGDRRPHLCRDP